VVLGVSVESVQVVTGQGGRATGQAGHQI
jgi:hypothetical protein